MKKYKRLTLEEREQTHPLVIQSKTNREISLQLNRSHTTISKKLKRCGTKFEYSTSKAHKKARGKDCLRGREQIVDSRPEVLQEVLKKLVEKHAPQQISGSIKTKVLTTQKVDIS